MSLDVSIYKTRVSSGYLTTVAGGTAISLGTTPYSGSGEGGTVSGVVYTTKDQTVQGEKRFDASTLFNYDVSIQQDLSVADDLYVSGRNVNDWDDAQDVSIAWLRAYQVVQDASIEDLYDIKVTKVYVDGSLNERDVSIAWLRAYQVVQDASIAATSGATKSYIDGSLGQRDVSIAWLSNNMLKEASIGDGFKWDSGLLEPSINTATALSELTDVTLSSLTVGDALAYRSGKWRNEITINIADVFQTKMNNFSPDSSGAGSMGDLAYDASYFYICTSTNIWMRFLGENNY